MEKNLCFLTESEPLLDELVSRTHKWANTDPLMGQLLILLLHLI